MVIFNFLTPFVNPEGLEKLKKELEYLKTVKRREIAERIKYNASFGDLSENAGYQEAKESQAFLEGKILELENLIKNSKVIKKTKRDFVQFGSIVILKSKNKKEKFQIVGRAEVNPLEGKISADSPLGKAILNKKKGATVKIEIPQGKIKYKIIEIE